MIQIKQAARDDLQKGYLFYEQQKPGLGEYFLESLSAEIDSLVIYAGVHPIVCSYYFMLAHRFPYAIYYRLDADVICVHAVLDCRRDPQKIIQRL